MSATVEQLEASLREIQQTAQQTAAERDAAREEVTELRAALKAQKHRQDERIRIIAGMAATIYAGDRSLGWKTAAGEAGHLYNAVVECWGEKAQ